MRRRETSRAENDEASAGATGAYAHATFAISSGLERQAADCSATLPTKSRHPAHQLAGVVDPKGGDDLQRPRPAVP